MEKHILNFLKFLKEKEGRTGWFRIEKSGKYNYINQEGKIISPDLWFDYGWNFNNGFGKALLNGIKYKINTEGKLFSRND